MPCQSGKRDSNPRPQPWQGCALPTELFPRRAAEYGGSRGAAKAVRRARAASFGPRASGLELIAEARSCEVDAALVSLAERRELMSFVSFVSLVSLVSFVSVVSSSAGAESAS